METEEDDSLFSSGDHGNKIVIEDDGKDRCGKGGIGKIIHRPAKDLFLLNGHVRKALSLVINIDSVVLAGNSNIQIPNPK